MPERLPRSECTGASPHPRSGGKSPFPRARGAFSLEPWPSCAYGLAEREALVVREAVAILATTLPPKSGNA